MDYLNKHFRKKENFIGRTNIFRSPLNIESTKEGINGSKPFCHYTWEDFT